MLRNNKYHGLSLNSDARYAAGIVGTSKEGLVVAFTSIERLCSEWWRPLPSSVSQYVREVSPAPCVFRQNRAGMEF